MKKRRYFAGAAAILFLLLLCGFAPQSITEDKDAQVLLYETYGESEILVYTGRTTVLYRPDGRSAEAPFNGQYAVLHGDTVTVFAETEEFLAVERFSAETLEETDLFALPVTSGLRFAESDSAGRLYAVTYGAPSTLQVFDAAGEPLTEFIFEDKIFGIQTVDSTLYVLLSESAVQISLAGNMPTLSGTAFTYAPAARPYKLLGSDVYVNMQGEVRLFSGEEWAEDTIVTEAILSGDMIYWLSDTSEVSRVRRGDKAEFFTLSGEAAALTANAAIIWQNGVLCRESFGTFVQPTPTPSPIPTPTPEPTATPKPSKTPKPTATPKPSAGSGCHGEVTCFRPHFVRRTGCYGSKATGSVPAGGSGSVHVILRSGLRQAENRHERADRRQAVYGHCARRHQRFRHREYGRYASFAACARRGDGTDRHSRACRRLK